MPKEYGAVRSRFKIIVSTILFIIAAVSLLETTLLALLIAAAGAALLAKGLRNEALKLFESEQVLRMLFFVTLGLSTLLVAGYWIEEVGFLDVQTTLLISGGVVLLAVALIEVAQFSRERQAIRKKRKG